MHSLIPMPFPPPVFDHLQYAKKTEGEGLGERVAYVTSGIDVRVDVRGGSAQ